MNRDQETELFVTALELAKCLREELPALRMTIAQLNKTVAGIAQDVEQINIRQAS